MKINNIKNKYLNKIINEYPNISSGRMNYEFYELRIKKNIRLIKNFIKIKKDD